MKLVKTLCVLAAVLCFDSAHAQVTFSSVWEATSGLLPDKGCPPWSIIGNNSGGASFEGDTLILESTNTLGQVIVFEHADTLFQMPDSFQIEFSVKVVTDICNFQCQSKNAIGVGFANDTAGSAFFIRKDTIYLRDSCEVRGEFAVVDTDDDFHEYIIKVVNHDSIFVYYDGILTLRGDLFHKPLCGGFPDRIAWGDGTVHSLARSKWIYFRYNGFPLLPCNLAGDPNNDGSVNIADITFLIARIFAGGCRPQSCAEGSANGDGSVNISDVTYLIARIFAAGPAPVCGPIGMGC